MAGKTEGETEGTGEFLVWKKGGGSTGKASPWAFGDRLGGVPTGATPGFCSSHPAAPRFWGPAPQKWVWLLGGRPSSSSSARTPARGTRDTSGEGWRHRRQPRQARGQRCHLRGAAGGHREPPVVLEELQEVTNDLRWLRGAHHAQEFLRGHGDSPEHRGHPRWHLGDGPRRGKLSPPRGSGSWSRR